jgi:serine protease inhibitor
MLRMMRGCSRRGQGTARAPDPVPDAAPFRHSTRPTHVLFRRYATLLALVVLSVCSTTLSGQTAPATLIVTLRDSAGRALPMAMLCLAPGGCSTADTAGVSVRSITGGGQIRMRARRLGLAPADTTVTIAPGERRELTLVLESQAAQYARLRAQAGPDYTIDSIAGGLIHGDTAGWFTFSDYSTRLLSALVATRTPRQSTMVSGYSAGQALSLALLGARGKTAIEMQRAIGASGLTVDSLALLNQRFTNSLRERKDVTLLVANAIFVDSSRALTPDFARRLDRFAPGVVQRVRLDRPSGVDRINQWAAHATDSMIPDLIKSPLDSQTKFLITNAIYLKAAWLTPFEKSRTRLRAFRTASGADVQAPTMHDTRYLPYRRGANWQAIRLPFRSGLTALYVILPDSGAAIAPLLAQFSDSGLPLPAATGTVREIALRLPTLHLKHTLDLIDPMRELGMREAFEPALADFRGLLVLDPRDLSYINRLKQRVLLDLDEEGAVAVAVTDLGGVIITSSSPKPPPIQFFVDRPFLFLIRDERTQTALFSGYIASPVP